jgi:iron complex outermembrane receptor protein
MRKQRKRVFIAFILTTIVVGSYAENTTKLEKITVTANKMEENMQNVPQTITVLDNIAIKEKRIKNITDVIKEIPNMQSFSFLGTEVNFRGLNNSLFTLNNPVVVYIDGIPASSRFAFDTPLVNVERVEVLRGPQGTLYGKDAIGAVINIVTKEPTNETTGSVGLEYGSNNYMQGIFNVNAPLVEDKLFFGINGQLQKDDGWVTNVLNNDDKFAKSHDYRFSTYLLYKFNERLSARIVLNKENVKKYGYKGYGLPNGTSIDEFKREDAKKVSIDVPAVDESKINSQALNIKYQFDNYTLNATTTNKSVALDVVGDVDNNYYTTLPYSMNNGLKQYFEQDVNAISQEIRVSSNNQKGIRWVGGLYLEKNEIKQDPYVFQFPNPPFGNFYMDVKSKIDSTTQAIFGQTMIPFYDKFELTLGARVQRIKKEIDSNSYMAPIGMTGPSFHTLNTEKTWNSFLPKIALSYKLNDSLTPYISISKGYMPGGFNFYSLSGTEKDNTFEPQQSMNYEVGVKGLFDNVSFGVSIFRMDIEDIHVYKQVGGTFVTENAKKAHSQGVELDFNYFPTDSLMVSGAFGVIDAKYDDYDDGTRRFDGEDIEKTPSHTANLAFTYTASQGYYGVVDIKNRGEMKFYNQVSQNFLKVKGATTANLKIGYKLNSWDIYGYAENITDEDSITYFSSQTSMDYAQFSDPRTFGVGVRYKF